VNVRLIPALQRFDQPVGVLQKKNAVGEIYVFFREPLKLGHELNLCRVMVEKQALGGDCYRAFTTTLADVSMNQPTRDCCRFIDVFSSSMA
jgi:hypothetical protein